MTRRVLGMATLGVGATIWFSTGCASLDDFRAAQRANNNLTAQNEKIEEELQDCRNSMDLLNARLDAAQQELAAKDERIASLQATNDVLADKMRMAERLLDEMGKSVPGNITVETPKLPAPLDSALKQFAAAHPDVVEFDSKRGFLKWKADLVFDLGSDVVKDSAKDAIRGFVDILNSQAAAGFEVAIVGHTCTTPIKRAETVARHPTNWHLSAHRSIAVADVIMQYGYAAQKIGVMGYGEYRPIADNAGDAGKAQNRRVEIYLVEQGQIFAMGELFNFTLPSGARFADLTKP
ncbi:MAG: OmpA family protein [Phycisphaerales bacterium]|nr:OmpA family protein [Phycisphaerales bacterium]